MGVCVGVLFVIVHQNWDLIYKPENVSYSSTVTYCCLDEDYVGFRFQICTIILAIDFIHKSNILHE